MEVKSAVSTVGGGIRSFQLFLYSSFPFLKNAPTIEKVLNKLKRSKITETAENIEDKGAKWQKKNG
jgi:hypothetical protein